MPRNDLPRPGDSILERTTDNRVTDARRVGVLGVQGDVSEHVSALERAGATAVWVKRPLDLDHVAGLVLPGGESTTLQQLLDYEGLGQKIQQRFAQGMPILGTCAGAILVADEVVGNHEPHLSLVSMRVHRNAYGRQRESFVTEVDVEGLEGGPVRAVFIRAPIIERVGSGVEVLATFDGEIVLAETDQALIATFHPELCEDSRLHRQFLAKLEAGVPAR